MKNYKKGLLCIMVLSAMPLIAAENKTIYVNTFDDEDNINSDKCSLREAVQAASLNKAYGGCSAGNTLNGQKDIIQLEAGEYKLEKEISPTSQIIIQGKSPADWGKKSPLTNDYPLMGKLVSKISGQNKTRLFNTLGSESTLTLLDVELTKGYSKGDGGALYVAGPLFMDNSAITASKSEKSGGAVYFVAQNSEKSLSLNHTLVEGNNAITGSVLAMDCTANLIKTKAKISITNSSIVKNGNLNNSSSTLDFCGYVVANLSANTIAKNIASSSNSSIINNVDSTGHPLSLLSSLILNSNTIVENTANNILYYDENGNKNLNFNVLAYNVGESCSYTSAKNIALNNIDMTAVNNAVELNGVSKCTLPDPASNNGSTRNIANNIDVSNISMTSILSSYQEGSDYNLYLPLYYPKDNKTNTDLVDVLATGCSEVDQRAIERVTSSTLVFNPTLTNSCDIGSVEMMHLTAADIGDLINSSAVKTIDDLQKDIDWIKALMNNKDRDPDYSIMDKDNLKKAEDLLKYTKQYQEYRTIYVDPFKLALPDEVEVTGAGARQLKALNSDNYEITAEAQGVGDLNGSQSGIDLSSIKVDTNLKCEWKPDLKRIIMYRLDGKETVASKAEYCKYTILNKATGISSSGILQARFTNIAPIANDDTYSISPSSNLEITVNPLENDSDDGDGSTTHLSTAKKSFYSDKEIGEIPIHIEKLPAGLTLTAERQGPCPGSHAGEICYGGKLHFAVKNNLSRFDYPVTYKIYDAEELGSNTATIFLMNTAENTNTSSGGGSFGIYGIFVLASLGLYRRYRMK
ncbi:CSLREA domain-containing protein [Acinetobacter sp. NS-4]|uniref:CSLREA domain-containing protein n=1 Tax=Acinetobacter sp. NS-4 TaxID=3127956 RepID=UPI00307EFE6F